MMPNNPMTKGLIDPKIGVKLKLDCDYLLRLIHGDPMQNKFSLRFLIYGESLSMQT